MTLFEECRNILGENFIFAEESEAINILKKFPLTDGNIDWLKIEHIDYVNFDEVIKSNCIKNELVFVVADNFDIPIFKTQLSLIVKNSDDVLALSPKIFIFNEYFLLQPLFPTEMIRFCVFPTPM